MKIAGVEPFVISTFHRNAQRHWLVCKLITDEPGLYGLGDASLDGVDEAGRSASSGRGRTLPCRQRPDGPRGALDPPPPATPGRAAAGWRRAPCPASTSPSGT